MLYLPPKRSLVLILCLAGALIIVPTNAQTEHVPSSRPQMQGLQGHETKDGSERGTARRKGIDMVFLLDISKSMDDIFADVRNSLIDYVQKALVGDRIAIISFGESTGLEVNRPIKASFDKQEIIRTIERLCPSDYSTYIVAAVDRGLRELVKLKKEGSTNIPYLILITDGKNNPPKSVREPLTFDTILKSYRSFKPGQDWFMYYITLRDVDDNDTQKFVHQVGGGIFNIESSSLAKCINSTEVPILTRIIDIFDFVEIRVNGSDSWISAVPDELLREGDSVRTGPEARAVVNFSGYGSTGVDVNSEFRLNRARLNPISDSIDISIHLTKGKLTNVFDDMPGYLSKFEVITPNAVPQVGALDSTVE